MAEADRILGGSEAELDARRATPQEATAIRLRVEELRTLSANARRELAQVPPPDERPLGSLLTAFRVADSDLEASEGKLRSIGVYDVNVRAGVDRFLDGPNQSTQFFGGVELGINLGVLWVGKNNDRTAAGRSRYVRSGHARSVPMRPSTSCERRSIWR